MLLVTSAFLCPMASAVTLILAWSHPSPEPVPGLLIAIWLTGLISLGVSAIKFLIEEPQGSSFTRLLLLLMLGALLTLMATAMLALTLFAASINRSIG